MIIATIMGITLLGAGLFFLIGMFAIVRGCELLNERIAKGN